MAEVHRRAGRTDVEVDAVLDTGEAAFTARTKNVGVGGVFIATPRTRPVGDRLALTFTLPGTDEQLSVQGEVRWTRDAPAEEDDRPAGMGLRFISLPWWQAIAIETFIKGQVDREGAGGSNPK